MKWNAVKRWHLVLRMSMRNAPRDIGVSEEWGKKKTKKKSPIVPDYHTRKGVF